ncbi:hypothetical protein CPB86DRAFT_725315 [Serendipita vermifera]|nr:hypothetical protein CPB86DRAFT_725315 [Serendipita vermifera]
MDNPYQQRQAQLLQRIVSNAQKCTEAISLVNEVLQEIISANADAETAAEIFALYRKVVRDSLQAAATENAPGTS